MAVSPDSGASFEFHALNDRTVNAFSLRGGYVFVTCGLRDVVDAREALAVADPRHPEAVTAYTLRASRRALSVRSQVKLGSVRPKWP